MSNERTFWSRVEDQKYDLFYTGGSGWGATESFIVYEKNDRVILMREDDTTVKINPIRWAKIKKTLRSDASKWPKYDDTQGCDMYSWMMRVNFAPFDNAEFHASELGSNLVQKSLVQNLLAIYRKKAGLSVFFKQEHKVDAAYERMESMLIKSFELAINTSEEATKALIRATGITSDELTLIGYDEDNFPKMHEWTMMEEV